MNIEEYSKIAPQYYSSHLSPILKKYLENENYIDILDCGCGDGSLLYFLNKFHFLDKKRVFAIDLSSKRIELVKKINHDIIANVDSAEDLRTIKDYSIDFFISTQVIEHVSDKKMVAQIEKKVRHGGVIYISTVFKKWFGWYFYRNNGKWVIDPTHLREYSADKDLLDLFNKDKFQLLENNKQLQWFPITDFVVKRINLRDRRLYEHPVMSILRKIKMPIVGYYHWELVFKRI